MQTRRDFVKLAVAGCLRDLPSRRTAGGRRRHRLARGRRDAGRAVLQLSRRCRAMRAATRSAPLIKAFTAVGLGDCELWAPQIEPAPTRGSAGARRTRPRCSGRARRRARPCARGASKRPSLTFAGIKKRFDDAGITIHAFNYSFNDVVLRRGNRTRLRDRQGPRRRRHHGVHHAVGGEASRAVRREAPDGRGDAQPLEHQDPNEFATPESFAAARKLSPFFKVNLDIGHFTAANYDAVAYIREHHDAITNLHIKDRKRNQGDNVPWGTGDTPIREVLQLLKKERWPIRAHVEYEYRGAKSPVEEVTECAAYATPGAGVTAFQRLRRVTRRLGWAWSAPGSWVRTTSTPSGGSASWTWWRCATSRRRRRRPRPTALGVPKAYGSVEALAADPAVHVVHVTTPNAQHGPGVRAALAHGKHVVCEKPLAIVGRRGAGALAGRARAGVVHAVMFNYRGNPMVQEARAMVGVGELGPGALRPRCLPAGLAARADGLLVAARARAGRRQRRLRRHRLALGGPGAARASGGRSKPCWPI